ncbi:MAG: hypothetical protein OEY52_12910 [Gammaproteobacteria bacterium]|nr:hypothetical protein [Gammaproteobacteria bacterium]
MLQLNQKIRSTGIGMIAAAMISLPAVSQAGWFDKVKSKTKSVTSRVTQKANNVKQNFGQNLQDNDLIKMVNGLKLKEQLQNTINLMEEMQTEYHYFSGGSGCGGQCANFRVELKGVLNEFLNLVYDIPALSNDRMLIKNLKRSQNLVNHIPPRALYSMWQIIGDQMSELQMTANSIREDLATLPTLGSNAQSGISARSVNSSNGEYTDGPFCKWVDDKPFVDLIQARLEQISWMLKSVADIIPDVEVKAEGGAEAGAAVANVTGAAGVGIKPTDIPKKLILKVIAIIPEQINWMIKINTLRAATVCQVVEYSKNR